MAFPIKGLTNRSGQVATEMVLMLVVLMGAILVVSSAFRDNEYFAQLVSGPWRSLAGLIQNGVYGPVEETNSKHPLQFERISSRQGDLLK